MITFYRCDGTDANFQMLIAALDAELTERYGTQMDFYGTFNGNIAAAVEPPQGIGKNNHARRKDKTQQHEEITLEKGGFCKVTAHGYHTG